jgi:hypothetical protein
VNTLRTLPVLLLLTSLARAEYTPVFNVGEDLTFRIRYGALTGGYSTLSVPQITAKDGRTAYHIVSEAKSTAFVDTFYKVRDFNQAWLDTAEPRSLGYEKNLREGGYRVQEEVRFDHANGKYYLEKQRLDKNKHTEREGPIPPNVLDILSSFYVMRGQPLEVGKSFTIDVHSGSKTWPLLVHVKRQEKVKVKVGRFDTYVLEPVLREQGIFLTKGKKLEIWVTSDIRRMPVQMRAEIFIGSVTAELVKMNLGTPSNSVAHIAPQSPVDESTFN